MNARPQLDLIAAARRRLSDRPAPAGLTKREVEILTLVGQGLTNSQIGERLFISPKTVEKHRTNLMKKLDLHNVSAVTLYAIQNGLISQ